MKLFIHEDDFSEIEILPASAAAWCAAEFARIEAFATRHEAPDGAGWTDIYLRPPAPAALASLAIPLDRAVSAIAARLPQFSEVASGTFSYPEPVANVLGFGRSPSAAVLLMGDKAATRIETLNLVVHAGGADAEALFAALTHLPSASALIAVDWQRGHHFALTDADQVRRYLQSL